MENFTAYNPTRLIFGQNVIENLHKNITKYGNKCLLLFGKNSAKKYGYYDKITQELNKADVKFIEYGGIKPNPIVEDVKKATELCKEEQIDFIVALGGGSVIDSAKIISLAYASEIEPWDIMKYKSIPDKAVPIIAVLTVAATGSEMNAAAVIQNHKTHEKIGYFNPLVFPNESYLDPAVTFTVSKEQTAYGISDIIAHILEAYFAEGNAELSDKLAAATLNEIFEVGPLLMKDLQNYDYRARVMWASTVALNGTLHSGRKSSGDWGVHAIGHVLSYLYDTPHGATLSIAFPAWMKYLKTKINDRLEKLGYLLTGEDISADETIKIFEKFYVKIGTPTSLDQIEVCRADMNTIKQYMEHTKVSGMNHKLSEEDYDKILRLM